MKTIELEDYEVPRVAVPVGRGKQIMVRGLNSDDLAFLVATHKHELVKALELYQEKRQNVLETGSITEFVLTFAKDFPAVVAEVISASTDNMSDLARKAARSMPVPVQLAVLNEVTRLTMEDAGGLKNLFAEMQERVKSLVANQGAGDPSRPKTNSPDSTTASETT